MLSLIHISIFRVNNIVELVWVSWQCLLDLCLSLLYSIPSNRCWFIIILSNISVKILVYAALATFLILCILIFIKWSNILRWCNIHLLICQILTSHLSSSRSCWLVIEGYVSEVPKFFKLNRMIYLMLSSLTHHLPIFHFLNVYILAVAHCISLCKIRNSSLHHWAIILYVWLSIICWNTVLVRHSCILLYTTLSYFDVFVINTSGYFGAGAQLPIWM